MYSTVAVGALFAAVCQMYQAIHKNRRTSNVKIRGKQRIRKWAEQGEQSIYNNLRASLFLPFLCSSLQLFIMSES